VEGVLHGAFMGIADTRDMRSAAMGSIATTSLHVERLCDCPFSIADEYAVQYLKRAEAGGSEAVVRAPLPFTRRKVRLSFGLSADNTEAGRQHEEIRVLWFADSPLFPDFRGTIRFRIDGRRTVILIDGTYHPPLGTFGTLFDRIAGRWIATYGLNDLARRIAGELEENERLWRSAHALDVA
jgi:hypothetical protein